MKTYTAIIRARKRKCLKRKFDKIFDKAMEIFLVIMLVALTCQWIWEDFIR